MELFEFEKLFSTDIQCRQYIAKIRWKGGFICPRCKRHEAWITAELKYKCKKCGYKMSVTAGTIFQDSHISLSQWFKVIWYISNNPSVLTISFLQKEIGIKSSKTAVAILKKLKSIIITDSHVLLNGEIDIAEEIIRVKNNSFNIITAIEVNNKKSGRIKICIVFDDLETTLNQFIKNNISVDSTLYLRDNSLLKISVPGEYTKNHRSSNYSFRYSSVIFNKLKNYITDNLNNKDISTIIKEFCLKYNSRYNDDSTCVLFDIFDNLNHVINYPIIKSN